MHQSTQAHILGPEHNALRNLPRAQEFWLRSKAYAAGIRRVEGNLLD